MKSTSRTPPSSKKAQTSILSFFGAPSARTFATPSPAASRPAASPVTQPLTKTNASSISHQKHAQDSDVKRSLFEAERHVSARKRNARGSSNNDEEDEIPLASLRAKRQRRVMRIADLEDDNENESERTMPPLDDDNDNNGSQGSNANCSVIESESNFDAYAPKFVCKSRNANPDVVVMDLDSDDHCESAAELDPARRAARERLTACDMDGAKVGDEEGGWCERHSWSTDIRDSKKRRPGDPDYDKTTLYIPPGVLSGTGKDSLTPFQKQYWAIKCQNYHVMLFFKKGKFYELYDVDADVAHKVLGLSYTKGGRVDMRCCGVPEQSFEKHIGRLIDHGYMVGRVEQTETANAAEQRKAKTKGKVVCERSLVRILTRATITDETVLRDHRARYVLGILEDSSPSQVSAEDVAVAERPCNVAVCFVDAASGKITIRQFEDDFRRTEAERIITYLQPQEIVVYRKALSERLSKLVQWASNRTSAYIVDNYENGFPSMTSDWLSEYLSPSEAPGKYRMVSEYVQANQLASKVFGGVAQYLRSLIIDKETLSLGNYELSPPIEASAVGLGVMDNGGKTSESERSHAVKGPSSQRLRMDAATLVSLEVLTSALDGSERGSLLSFIDRAKTAPGRRLLRKWLSAPLVCSEDIEDRLNAIDALNEIDANDGGACLNGVSKKQSSGRDLERALPRLHQQAVIEDTAVMFDDTNKRRVKEFLRILRALESSLEAIAQARDALSTVQCKSARLKWLLRSGCGVPADAFEKLNYFFGDAFDVSAAESTGDIIPNEGAAPEFDEKNKELKAVTDALDDQLKKWRQKLKDRSIKFYHRGKEPYQLEVPSETVEGCIPSCFELTSENKGVKRFYTPEIRKLLKEHITANEAFQMASKCVAREIISQFDKHYDTWSAVAQVSAELDALLGLARASQGDGSGPMCRPTVLPNDHALPVFSAKELRHPVLAAKSESFVPNDVDLGGDKCPRIAVLTGPNAGGKSTLSRQIAVCVLIAQVGCYVPARELTFRPFEDVFVRMGASDDISRGLSTFMVEMEDVGNILNNSTDKSLVIADEVGRGTSTHDGYAIAFATLRHLALQTKCISVFSTHYSMLGNDLAVACEEDRRSIGMYEMAAEVDETEKKITFLYKFQRGVSGQSRGICCARLAGIPATVADHAEIAAADFEKNLSEQLASSAFQVAMKALKEDDETIAEALQIVR